MKRPILFPSVIIIILVTFLLQDTSLSEPRAQTVKLTCGNELEHNTSIFVPNFVGVMENISVQMRNSGFGVAVVGSGPNTNYGLAQCHSDLPLLDCVFCYAVARTVLPQCFPFNGGSLFLDGCFMRYENYNFFQEYFGPTDQNVCGNKTRKSTAFHISATQAVLQAVSAAAENNGFARAQVPVSGTNELAYVLADCWRTLDPNSCRACLQNASASIFGCLPWSEGRALNAGCFLRYSDTDFLNPIRRNGSSRGPDASSGESGAQVFCGTQVQQNGILITNFAASTEGMSGKMLTSGVSVLGGDSEHDRIYGLAQCYGDLPLNYSVHCLLCFFQAQATLRQCLPAGGKVFLDSCFMRAESYSFFHEYTGRKDTTLCGDKILRNSALQVSVKQAIGQAVLEAPNNNGYAQAQVPVSRANHESSYVLATCWETLNADSCRACLENASATILGCFPSSEGRAMNTGCFMRYSDTDFLYLIQQRRSSRGKNNINESSRGKTKLILGLAVSSITVLVIGAVIAGYILKQRRKQKKRQEKPMKPLYHSCLDFKYSILEKATGSFDEANKLGQGGFGTVYKGVLEDGREIAVKRLFFNNKHRAADFFNEVNIISTVEHKNLVKLLGCNFSGPESLLVYEFLPNKSLDFFIFDSTKGKALNWEKRLQIIIGTAEGLIYLHENKKTRIVHRDIKASNILLESNFQAKIADFGLARSFQENESHISTAIAGTLGYMAPEYLARGQLTEKADVYSFGVLVIEIVTGKQNNRRATSEYSDSSLTKAWKHFQQRTVEEMFDRNLDLHNYDDNIDVKKEVTKAVHVALLCTQENPSLRPSMSNALEMLVMKEENLPTPTKPPYIYETVEVNDILEERISPLHRVNPASIATISQSIFGPR